MGKSDGSDRLDLADGCAGLKIWYNGNGFSGRAGISGEGGWVRLVGLVGLVRLVRLGGRVWVGGFIGFGRSLG